VTARDQSYNGRVDRAIYLDGYSFLGFGGPGIRKSAEVAFDSGNTPCGCQINVVQSQRESLTGAERPSPFLGSAETVRHNVVKRLVLLLANLLPVALASERLFHALLFARLQIKGVALDLLDNVFGLNLALEPAQGILKGFAFLNSNLCQGYTPPNSPKYGYTSGYYL
jgi:hypothetical protein